MPFKSLVVGCLHFQGEKGKKEEEKKLSFFLKAATVAALMLEEPLVKTSGPILAQCSAAKALRSMSFPGFSVRFSIVFFFS